MAPGPSIASDLDLDLDLRPHHRRHQFGLVSRRRRRRSAVTVSAAVSFDAATTTNGLPLTAGVQRPTSLTASTCMTSRLLPADRQPSGNSGGFRR
jgi:hypothetical protein